MSDEYQKAREEFDPIFYLIGLGIFAALYWILNRDKKEIKKDRSEGDPKKTFFTRE